MKKLFLLTIILLFVFTACNQENSLVTPEDSFSDEQAAIVKLIEEDEAILSFEPNYNEEEVMSFFGKVTEVIYPVRVGQRMIFSDRNIETEIVGDSAFVSVTHTFNGILFIAASYDEIVSGQFNNVDTLIEKEFTSQITRNIIMVKIANTETPLLNWRVKSISLPEGGTLENGVLTNNIEITKMTLTLQNGEVMEITDPNNYFLTRMPGYNNQIPVLGKGEEVTVNIELQSAYADSDFVTLTFGALRGMPHHRAKMKFDLISSEFDGTYYQRTYQQTFTTHFIPGFRHAIINAIPNQVINDDSSPVEQNSWGMPYVVR